MESEEGKWAIVKNVKIGANAPSNTDIIFIGNMIQFIGKRIYLVPSRTYLPMWQHYYTPPNGYKKSYLFDKQWLTFEDDEEPNLFTRDPILEDRYHYITATVKNIRVGTTIHTKSGWSNFSANKAVHIGKKILVRPEFENQPNEWWITEFNVPYHKDWLTFEDNEEPNLFTRDPH